MCTGNWKISDQLRVPATTKMQVQYNIQHFKDKLDL